MKKINIVLAVLFAALVLGFTSCKQPKDVNIVDQYTSSYDYYYDISGTATQSGTAYTVKGNANFWWSKTRTDTNLVTLGSFISAGAYDASGSVLSGSVLSGSPVIDEDVLDLDPLVKLNGKISTTKTTNGETKYVDISDRFSNGSIGDSSFTYTYTEPTSNAEFVLTFTKF
jgi:hypothetical protein